MEMKLYTTGEVMEILKVQRRTLYNYIKQGQLNGIKFGCTWRFTEEEVQRFLSTGTEKNYLKK